MDYSYDEIVAELKIFTRNYSQCRSNFSKWRSYKIKISEIPDKALAIHDIEGKLYALIYREFLHSIEAFQFTTFMKRILIKRNEHLFKEVQNLWKLLNPFHLSGISKQVYTKFYEFIHFSVLDSNSPIEDYEKVLKTDAEIDFNNLDVQNFSEFYDTLFENIDAYTKSTLVNEYCRALKRICSEVKRSSWIKSLDLHNKLHTEGVKPQYPPWALPHLRGKSFESPPQIMRNTLLTATVPTRLTAKTYKKTENLRMNETRYERMVSPWSECEKTGQRTVTPIKLVEIKQKKNKGYMQISSKNETNLTPNNIKLKAFKDKKLIEKIVQDRLGKTSGTNSRVLHTPVRFFLYNQ